MFSEDDLLPVSALQHLQFCERQCALIHIEGLWEENVYTTEGKHLHEKAHSGTAELRGDTLTVRSLRLRSLRLGLSGQADIVEFHRTEVGGVPLPRRPGLWCPFPVEYKRGKPKRDPCDEVQLCAQALCLEEMYGVRIENGALFYGEPRRRHDVEFLAPLRELTGSLARRLHELIASGRTPRADYSHKKCSNCSLIQRCRPQASTSARSVSAWLEREVVDEL